MSDDTAVGISLEFAKCENSNDSCHGTVELDSDHGTDTVAATVLQNKKCKSNADDSIPNSSHESNYAHHFTGKHTGRKYWQIVSVFSSFIVNMFYGGLAASYGVMYSYMKEPLGVSEEEVTWFGSLFGGLIGIASILAMVCVEHFGGRLTTLVGGLLAASGLILGSQVNDLNLMYCALGFLPGAGVCLAYNATMVNVNNQFSKWRPLAVGISVTGIAIGVLVFPPVSAVTADVFGWRGTFLIYGALILHFIPCAVWITPRNNTGDSDSTRVSLGQTIVDFLRLLRSPDVIIVAIAHISLGFGYYTFATFIPDYVTTSPYSMTTSEASLIVSSLGYGSIAGRIIFSGISMASHKATNYIFILSVCVCGLTNLLVPLCKDSIAFYTNGVAYGIALGGWNGVHTILLVKLFGLDNLSKSFSMCVMCQGIGSFGGAPLQGYFATLFDKDMAFYSAGTSFILTVMFMVIIMQHHLTPCPVRRKSFKVVGSGFANVGFIAGSSDTVVAS
ncbi:monocarboxylate transporter 13-like [Haliotis cracherodii]|uniref:monocarboxylate transporter 13-like n=1 Tax=Haliotis cracherodii TaxID=6455 RepID=UPI0039E863F2